MNSQYQVGDLVYFFYGGWSGEPPSIGEIVGQPTGNLWLVRLRPDLGTKLQRGLAYKRFGALIPPDDPPIYPQFQIIWYNVRPISAVERLSWL